MENESNPIVGCSNIHSCLVRQKFNGNSVIVKERIQRQDGSIEPKISIYRNPKHSFYLTKDKFRTHKYSKEYEYLSRLDKFTCYDHEMNQTLAKALGIYTGGKWVDPSSLYKSPYVYGADINIEALIKMRYCNKFPDTTIAPVSGFLDIETSIYTGEVILISFVENKTVHTAALRAYCYKEEDGKRVPFYEDEIVKLCKENLAERTKGIDYTYNFKIFDQELQLVAWIFDKIHKSHVDFVGIWNINFDIPKIIGVIEKNNVNPANIFSHPEVPNDLKYFRYVEDKNEHLAHFTLKWHKVLASASAQFIDSMALFSHCRKTAGFRDSYTLESVLQDMLKMGKLPLESGSHTFMQQHRFREYCVYNAFDVIGLDLLERKNQDITALVVLSGVSPVLDFNRMTARSTNSLYFDLISKGMVLKSYSRDDDFAKFDKLFPNVGGSVLDPSRITGVGISLDY